VIYTSGSTGNPKGVMVEHRQLASRLLGASDELGLGSGDVFPNLASPAFDIALFEVLMPLLSGGRSLLLSAAQVRDIGRLRELTQHATVFHAVPSLMEAWLEALDSGGASTPYASLHTLLVGGEAVPERLLRKLTARFPHARVFELYGPTEAVIVSTRYRADGGAVDGVAHCIGRPFANTRTYILDAQLQPAPVGVGGELYVGGLQVARGYLNRTELTAERFVPSPFVAGDRLYKTGDLARYLPGGNIEFLGRSDFQVKIRGFRIELGEIEAKLATYPGVRAAVVVAVDGAAAEDAAGEKRLVAYYTAEAGAEISVEALRAHLLSLLPEYMVPAAYVPLESLPLTSNGKLDRKALPAPDGGAYVSREYEAPADEMERALASIWRELLNVERVGRNDDFFEIGGHSLLAMGLLSRVRDALQVEVDLNELFSHPTLREFARALKTSSRSTLPPIVPVDRSESIPLSFAQERLWFLAHLDPTASRAYHLPFSLPMKGELDVPALRRALDDIVARHESLRTTFTAVDGEPAQRIGPADSGFHLVEDDLRGAADAAGELKKLSAQHAGAPFDFETGPLVRGRLVRLADDEHVLMVATHHIVSDGWSMGVFMRELRALYAAYSAGEPSPLAPLAVQYADYAVWQRRWISGETLQEQASYWQRALADAPVLLELPTDRPRPAVRDPRGGRVGFALDAELTARVKALSRRHGATLYMTLLAAWGALLSRLSGQEDVVIGTAVANRVRPETEPLIGFFANTLPVRLNFAGNPTLGELLERVKAQAIAAQEHQDVPFEHIVELVNPPRSLSHSPLFQAMFLWQNMQRTERALPGLKAEPMDGAPTSGGSAQFDLTLDLSERGDRIAGSFSYVTALFDRATIERYGGYLQRMIAAMVADD
jgi:non-ribosomal peptide synthetase component F/aryl carrier-like protein